MLQETFTVFFFFLNFNFSPNQPYIILEYVLFRVYRHWGFKSILLNKKNMDTMVYALPNYGHILLLGIRLERSTHIKSTAESGISRNFTIVTPCEVSMRKDCHLRILASVSASAVGDLTNDVLTFLQGKSSALKFDKAKCTIQVQLW